MQTKRLVVIGTSAGGIDALRTLLAALPADFSAAIAVVVHTAPESPGVLPEILGRATALRMATTKSGEPLGPGRVYVAPPDHHLLIEPGRVRLTKGPRENRFRPAIDPLFRSAAQVFGPAAIGVILTGNLDDGTAGLWTIKRLGGAAIVQDPDEAPFPSMPASAIHHVEVDHVVNLAEIGPLLVRLTAAPVEETPAVEVPEDMAVEIKIAGEEDPLEAGIGRLGEPSPIACPECHGVLLQLKARGPIRFRCHTGHAYTAESLLAEIGEGVEIALWNAIRSLQEAGILVRQLARHAETTHHGEPATMVQHAEELERRANQLRSLVTSSPQMVPAAP
jgi:two-component system, chemotaxis family, protein-glutamate methylesterase/glutaminase